MSPNFEALYEAAMSLPESQRAELADRLLDSLAQKAPSQLHPAWQAELKRRSGQVDSGEVTPVSWDEVRRIAWEATDQDRASHDG